MTRGYRVSPTPLFMLAVNRDQEMLHEVSGVKVPRPASPFITHETPLSKGVAVAVSRGNCMGELINSSTWCDRE